MAVDVNVIDDAVAGRQFVPALEASGEHTVRIQPGKIGRGSAPDVFPVVFYCHDIIPGREVNVFPPLPIWLQNIRAFSPRAYPHVTVNCTVHTADGGVLVVCVRLIGGKASSRLHVNGYQVAQGADPDCAVGTVYVEYAAVSIGFLCSHS